MLFYPTKTSPPIKTPTRSNIHDRKSTHSAVTPLTLLPIAGMLGTTAATTATSFSTGNVGVYSAIAISAWVDIICKRVTNIVKDV